MLQGQWNYPTQISVGAGCVKQLVKVCQSLNIQSPLLVSDPGLSEQPFVLTLMKRASEAGLQIELFDRVQGNPTGQNVFDGITVFNTSKHDGVIALGGGSSLDTAKAIALAARQQVSLWELEDIGDNWLKADAELIAPVIAIPTTAGTGSEVGRASVITDQDEGRKRIIFHPQMLPVHVLLDPELTTSLPAHLTAATGMDALSHNLEALCAQGYHPMAEGIAMEGIRLVHDWLPIAYSQPDDLEARTQMLVASSMGATAFQKGLGAMHAIAHVLGARYNKHHGLLNAILMPWVMEANRSAIEPQMERLGRYLGLPVPDFDGVLHWVLELRRELHIPHTLAEIGLDTSDADLIGELATQDAAASGNPILFSSQQYASIYRRAVIGD